MGAFKSQIFTAQGSVTFNVPSGVSFVWVNMTGGACGTIGALGAGGYGGGGSAETCCGIPLPCTPGGTITGYIGDGGVAGVWNGIGTALTVLTGSGEATTFGGLSVCGSIPAPSSLLVPNRNDGTTSRGGDGGGPTGQTGDTGLKYLSISAQRVKPASLHHFGGSGGGGGATGSGPTAKTFAGTGSGGFITGDPPPTNNPSGGGGGGSTPWGAGGAGGLGATGLGSAGPTASGAGTGSPGGNSSVGNPDAGTKGTSGRIEVFWFE